MKSLSTVSKYCLFLIVLFSTTLSPAQFTKAMSSQINPLTNEPQVQTQPHLSAWFWHTSMIETNTSDVISFIKQQQIKVLYLQVNPDIQVKSYQNFIEKMSEIQVEVHALDGSPLFSSPGKEELLHNFYTWLTTYQEQSEPNQKFKGVHLDVEPYLHSDWQTDRKNAVLHFQHFVLKAKTRADLLNLPLTLDIPFWFDEINFTNQYGNGNLAEWIIKKVDAITIMAYRDSSAKIIPIVAKEIQWANQLGKKVVIGLETYQTEEPPFITFHEEGEAVMKEQFKHVHQHYVHDPSYAGISIHDIKNWMGMKK